MKLKYYLRGLGIGMLVAALILTLSKNSDAGMSDEAVKRRAAELGMVERDKTVLSDIGDDAASGEEPQAETPESGEMPKEGAAVAEGNRKEQSGETEENGGEQAEEADAEEQAEAEASGENAQSQAEEAGAEENAQSRAKEPGTEENAQGQAKEAGSKENAQGQTKEAGSEENAQGQTKEAGGEENTQEQEAVREIEQKADEVADRAREVAENSVPGRIITLEVRNGDSSVSVARKAAEAGLVKSAADFDVFLCRNGYDKRISVGNYEITEGASEKEIADIITKSR